MPDIVLIPNCLGNVTKYQINVYIEGPKQNFHDLTSFVYYSSEAAVFENYSHSLQLRSRTVMIKSC